MKRSRATRPLFFLPAIIGSLGCQSAASSEPLTDNYDPIAFATAQLEVSNAEAPVPSQCYTKTEGVSNPCWTCHTRERYPNAMADVGLQLEYSFSDVGQRNHWRNLFADRSDAIAAQSDQEILSYVREDNYTPLRNRMLALRDELQAKDYVGYIPDLDLAKGFDDEGFARDGSGWRAFRYKPFLGTFWPTNGATDDVFVRLPERFRVDVDGQHSRAVYKANLAILEMALATPPDASEDIEREIELVDEARVRADLDRDGHLGLTSKVVGTPKRYVGGAASVAVDRGLYPNGTEFLHSVRYLDPDAPSMIATRMKELRYSRKTRTLDRWAINYVYEQEYNEKEEGNLPVYSGSALTGLKNSFGWQLQGFIEDAQGRLRLQSKEEHRFCMGCHSTVGVTADQTFAFPRKVPGVAGWGYQSLEGIPDVPQVGHDKPEILTYFERVGGGDEFRANAEMLDRFFKNGSVDEAKVLQAAPGGPDDIRALILPSRRRALLLNKAYRALVREQSFIHGRDTVVSPTKNVHERIDNGDTGLARNSRVYSDGRLHLDWEGRLTN